MKRAEKSKIKIIMEKVAKIKIFLGADHAGYDLKNKIYKYLQNHGLAVVDLSPDFIKGDDYPKPAFKVAHAVRQNTGSRGILFCGSGGWGGFFA